MAPLQEQLCRVLCDAALTFVSLRSHVSCGFMAQLCLLCCFKCLHCLAQSCVELRPYLPRFLHYCFSSSLLGLVLLNLHLSSSHGSQYDDNPFLLYLGFEHFILSITLIITYNQYGLIRRRQQQQRGPRDEQLVSAIVAVVFCLVRVYVYMGYIMKMLTLQIFPIFAFHPMYLAIMQLKEVVLDSTALIRVGHNGSTVIPGAPPEAVLPDDRSCVICREEMGPEVTALPCCHVFHTSCLRSWFQRQWTCPMCRMSVQRGLFPELQPPAPITTQPPDPIVQPPDPPSRPSTPPQTPVDPQPQDWEEEAAAEEPEDPEAEIEEIEETEDDLPPVRRYVSQDRLRELRARYRRHVGESMAAWLLRCWDDDATSVTLEGREVERMVPLANHYGVDAAMCNIPSRSYNLWKRMLNGVRECYSFRDHGPIALPWFTLDEGIQYLRQMAVLEMLYADSYQPHNPNADESPDFFKCTPLMWCALTATAPPTYIGTLSAMQCLAYKPTTVMLLAAALKDYDKNVGSIQRRCLDLVEALSDQVTRLNREIQECKRKQGNNSLPALTYYEGQGRRGQDGRQGGRQDGRQDGCRRGQDGCQDGRRRGQDGCQDGRQDGYQDGRRGGGQNGRRGGGQRKQSDSLPALTYYEGEGRRGQDGRRGGRQDGGRRGQDGGQGGQDGGRGGQDGGRGGGALSLVEEGRDPRATFWFYLRDHGENMRRWDGKPTAMLQRRVEELMGDGPAQHGANRRRFNGRRSQGYGATYGGLP